MIPFRRRADGVHLTLSSGERAMLDGLVQQLRQIVDGDLTTDPVAARLFPAGYREDDEAAAEFRRYTFDDLRSQKSENARIVHEWLTGTTDGAFDRADGPRGRRRDRSPGRLRLARLRPGAPRRDAHQIDRLPCKFTCRGVQ
jgi:hypothetical protein